MSLRSKILLIPICMLLCHMACGQSYTITPRDDAHKKDLTLYAFVSNLQFIVAKRDKDALLAEVDSNILVSFGAEHGIADFKRIWDLDNKDSRLWSNLARLVKTGGTVDDKGMTVCFPYMFTAPVPDSVDLTSVFFVAGSDVKIRLRPDSASKIIGKLDNEIVYDHLDTSYIPRCKNKAHAHYAQPGEDQDWRLIHTFDRRMTGYVYWDYLWSPFGYRMFISKKSGKWKITCLVNGD